MRRRRVVRGRKAARQRVRHQVVPLRWGPSARRSCSSSRGSAPRSTFARTGIDVVADLPGVGGNLHDHLLSPVIFTAEREIGPPSPGSRLQTHLFWRSRPGLPAPDLQPIHFMVPMYEPWIEGPTMALPSWAGWCVRSVAARYA